MADNKAIAEIFATPAAMQEVQDIVDLVTSSGIVRQNPEIVSLLVAWRMLSPEQKVDQYAHLFKLALDNRDKEVARIKEAKNHGKRVQPNG